MINKELETELLFGTNSAEFGRERMRNAIY